MLLRLLVLQLVPPGALTLPHVSQPGSILKPLVMCVQSAATTVASSSSSTWTTTSSLALSCSRPPCTLWNYVQWWLRFYELILSHAELLVIIVTFSTSVSNTKMGGVYSMSAPKLKIFINKEKYKSKNDKSLPFPFSIQWLIEVRVFSSLKHQQMEEHHYCSPSCNPRWPLSFLMAFLELPREASIATPFPSLHRREASSELGMDLQPRQWPRHSQPIFSPLDGGLVLSSSLQAGRVPCLHWCW